MNGFNDTSTVSNSNSVKLQYSWRCELPLVRREDPVQLYWNVLFELIKYRVGTRNVDKMKVKDLDIVYWIIILYLIDSDSLTV